MDGHSSKRSRKRRKARRKPINVLASALSTTGLYCGIASIFKAIEGDFRWAATYILFAIVFDVLDGAVAKITHTTSEFGKELDSLCDLVSFGVAPAVLIYTAYIYEPELSGSALGRTGSVVAVIYVICGALRLARFNVYQSEIRDYFIGLPIPAAACTVASFVLFTSYFNINAWVFTPLTLALAYLMISTVRYPKDKMKALALAPRNAFRILVLCGLGIALFHELSQQNEYSIAIALFPLSFAYVLFGIGDTLYHRLRRRTMPSPLPAQADASSGDVDVNNGDLL